MKVVLVALVRESLSAPTRPRREAASQLVDVLNSKEGVAGLPATLERMRAQDIAVAAAMRILIEEYGLKNSD